VFPEALWRSGWILVAATVSAAGATFVAAVHGIRDGLTPEIAREISAFLFVALDPARFRPEPLERMQAGSFFAGALVASVALHVRNPPARWRALSRGSFLVLAAALTAISLVWGRDSAGAPNITSSILHNTLYYADSPLWLAAFAFLMAGSLPRDGARGLWTERAVLGIAAGFLVFTCARSTWLEPVPGLAPDGRNHHSSAVLHSIVVSLSGAVPYVDFIPQYGGYGMFAAPFAWLIGDGWWAVSLFLFAGTVATIAALATSVFLVTGQLAPAIQAAVLAMYLLSPTFGTEPYYQVFPVRTLFPALFLLAFAAMERYPRAMAAAAGAMAPVAFYWNPETGLFCTLASVASFVVFGAMDRLHGRGARQVRSQLTLLAAAMLVAGVAGYGLLSLAGGRLFDAATMLLYPSIFSLLGLGNLPMPLLDLWIPFAFLFVLLVSLPLPGEGTREDAFALARYGLFCGVLFALLSLYYQGRSFADNLFLFVFPLVAGAVAWAARPIAGVGDGASRLTGASWVAAFAFAGLVACRSQLPEMALPWVSATNRDDAAIADFVQGSREGDGNVLVISPQAWRIHLLSAVPAPPEVAPLSSLLTRAQLEVLVAELDPARRRRVLVDAQFFHDELVPPALADAVRSALDRHWEAESSLDLPTGRLVRHRPRG
jgi:hypothetical protein